MSMKRVTGLGGVFIKAKDPKKMAAWYETHLGIVFQDNTYTDIPLSGKQQNMLSFFKQDTKYLDPSPSSFMINLRVEDLDNLLEQLKQDGVLICEGTEDGEFGKFGWILDPEQNKIELWQPPEKS